MPVHSRVSSAIRHLQLSPVSFVLTGCVRNGSSCGAILFLSAPPHFAKKDLNQCLASGAPSSRRPLVLFFLPPRVGTDHSAAPVPPVFSTAHRLGDLGFFFPPAERKVAKPQFPRGAETAYFFLLANGPPLRNPFISEWCLFLTNPVQTVVTGALSLVLFHTFDRHLSIFHRVLWGALDARIPRP